MNLLTIVFSASMVLAAVPVAAQQAPSRPERPYRGLFGGGVSHDAEQRLGLNLSLGGGFDDNVLADGPPAVGVQAQGGRFGGVSGQLAYSLNRTRVGMNASLATSGRYYPGLRDTFVASHSGGIGVFVQVARSTRLAASHTTSYQPFLTLGLFPQLFEVPGQSLPPSLEFGIERSDYFNHTSGINLTQRISSKASLSGYYGRQRTDFRSVDRDFSSHSGGGRFSLGLAKGVGMRIGYGFTDALYSSGGSGSVQGHNIDAGIDFDRALSFTRRTTLAFGTGSAVFVDRERTYYHLLANARLNREIGRTWNASLSYARTAGFIESLSGPVFSDGVTFAYGGMINRRLQFRSSVAASVGNFALEADGSGFDTYAGSAGLTYGMTRHLGLGVSYSYYRYSFDAGAPLPRGVSRDLDRQSVQANLNVWVPLMHRSRRPDASR